jgi:EipB-like
VAQDALQELTMKHMLPLSARMFLGAGITLASIFTSTARAAPAQELAAHPPAIGQGAQPQAVLVPHRAVYRLTLGDTGAGSNVSDIRGQLVYDFQGSVCLGYTLNTRLVTQVFDRDGKPSVSDIRSESWEDANGEHFRFATSQYADGKLAESTKGTAHRAPDHPEKVAVRLEKPQRANVTLTGNILFPTQHSLHLLKAALAGLPRLQADIYDGSEKGAKVYETTSLIGGPLELSANSQLPSVKNSNALDAVPSWPVVVSYFDQTPKKDGLPAYEISFRMYSNGVSRKLKLDYGTFSLNGELSSIDFYEDKPCR